MFVLYTGGGVSEDDGALLSENYLFVNLRVCMHVGVCLGFPEILAETRM